MWMCFKFFNVCCHFRYNNIFFCIFQTMSASTTSIPGNTTNTPNIMSDNSSKIGLAVGLPIFFVALLLAGIAVLLWFRHRKSVDIELSNKLKSQDKSHDGHSRESPYSGYGGGLQPAPQSPIYENFQSGQSNLHEFQRSAAESQETHR